MPNWYRAILGLCALIISAGAYQACAGAGHERAARGDHLLSIIRWRDESDALEREDTDDV